MRRLLRLSLLLLAGCSVESSMGVVAQGYISMRVADDVGTIRFIVFSDPHSLPRVELNEFHSPAARRVVLKVAPADKLVVAIADEPDTLHTALDNVDTLRELEQIELALGSIASADHSALKAAMPTTGAVRTARADVKATPQAAEANPMALSLERVLARVDVCLATDFASGAELLPGSTVTLRGTHTHTPFIRHGDELGRIQTVENLTSRAWSGTARIPAAGDPTLVCSFYTPERHCRTNRLSVELALRTAQGDKRASIELAVDTVRRNNRYIVEGIVRRSIHVDSRAFADTMKSAP